MVLSMRFVRKAWQHWNSETCHNQFCDKVHSLGVFLCLICFLVGIEEEPAVHFC